MAEKTKDTLEDLFSELNKDPSFRREYRRQAPYYQLLRELRARRKELGWTQQQLAENAGTHQSNVSRIESGELDVRLSTLIDLAEAMGAKVDIRLTPFEIGFGSRAPHTIPSSLRGDEHWETMWFNFARFTNECYGNRGGLDAFFRDSGIDEHTLARLYESARFKRVLEHFYHAVEEWSSHHAGQKGRDFLRFYFWRQGDSQMAVDGWQAEPQRDELDDLKDWTFNRLCSYDARRDLHKIIREVAGSVYD